MNFSQLKRETQMNINSTHEYLFDVLYKKKNSDRFKSLTKAEKYELIYAIHLEEETYYTQKILLNNIKIVQALSMKSKLKKIISTAKLTDSLMYSLIYDKRQILLARIIENTLIENEGYSSLMRDCFKKKMQGKYRQSH